ncbi:thiamine diphosphokinase [Parabacteroides sp. AM08-6]|uniref:thiamine diphosphokinase n=1 Tax=Parabacteroides sp. AM08-6 TaxID=2292053 RepID=UPI000EFE786A|nr:thiamine diphosphokinase [Parabacteroides sp. AM08-6]RHJ86450.1 thiamine diphosphokinase [Parabacteroides sp. AM08-6]
MIAPYNCVIVANGSFPRTALPLDLLQKASVIIACDGAVEALHHVGLEPDAIVGDLDSIPSSFRQQYIDRIHIVKDQEINDLTKAVRFAYQAGHKEILILGATGLREDHAIGNISLLMEYAPMFERVEMLSDYGLFIPLLHTRTLQSIPGQQVSIFSINPEGEISTEGLRWPIFHRRLTAWWQGTLNEATGTEFTINLFNNAKVIIYKSHEQK